MDKCCGSWKDGVDNVIIPKSLYEELLEDSMFLSALEDLGLENWDKYEEALAWYEKVNEERD